ncbi:MAG: NAD(P)-binding protein [Firmicutes bacterium]|nr:NAD(P)-binding protein [Bacillota bacterium]
MKRYLEPFENCMEKEIPYCVGDCPFHIEILNFMEKAARGSMKAAFKVYRNATGFPRIANALCDAPCQRSCPLGEQGDPVRLDLLEKAALELTADTSATDYNIPPKKEKIAIIGAGLSGMAALLRLSTKKYTVEVFEKSDRTGGHLWDILDPELFQKDFEEQLAHQDYTLHLNTEIKNLSELSGFDAVYIATGKDGQDFGLLEKAGPTGDKFCAEEQGTGYFAGGQLIGDTPLYALAGGLAVGTVIDNYLKTKSLYYPKGHKKTRMCVGMIQVKDPSPAVSAAGGSYTKEEACQEAARCVRCQCSACKDHCDLLEFMDKQPLRVRDEIVATTLEGKSELKATPAKRLMSMCNQCGICKEVCPEDIDLDGLFLLGRQKMHKQGKMPWPYHDFWLRDMAQANSEQAALLRAPKGQSACGYALFPGCQLGASEPELIVKLYDSLLNQHPDTAMFLQCCGVPLLWAGDREGFDAHMAQFHQAWEDLGQPMMIIACPTCMKHFKEYLPQIPVVSLPELLRQWDISGGCCEETYAVFDPCSARDEEGMRQAVRDLAKDLGISLEPLPDNNEYFTCCGTGGHGADANLEYAEFVAKKRISESSTPYITYCINCRDTFLKQGKEARHILELIFGEGSGHQHLPTITQRQENRRVLKETLLEFFWEEQMNIERKEYPITVEISSELKEKLDEERILEEQILHTIDFCQRHGRTILDEESGTLSGYCQIGYMTYWAEYKALDEAAGKFQLVNAYSHRTKIELEAVWNGIKQEIDLQ